AGRPRRGVSPAVRAGDLVDWDSAGRVAPVATRNGVVGCRQRRDRRDDGGGRGGGHGGVSADAGGLGAALSAGTPVRRQRHIVGVVVDADLDRGGGTVVGGGWGRGGRRGRRRRSARPRHPEPRRPPAELPPADDRPQARRRRLRNALTPGLWSTRSASGPPGAAWQKETVAPNEGMTTDGWRDTFARVIGKK